ncbi:MAG: heavy metal translocating P-type ATPase metal-binding domain-containing protein [Polyangiaceae bacterium]|nr:heavy metal translocating P-type ATPase metal-binding domain-containing protein [Polyangiaceae bacterium]
MSSASLPATRTAPLGTKERAQCLHCGTLFSAKTVGASSAFCCRGCEAVYALLRSHGLGRFYDLGGGAGHPVVEATPPDRKWLEPIAAGLAKSQSVARIALDVQGVHCSACVWLFEELFRRQPGACSIVVNPGIGSVSITVSAEFPLEAFIESIEAFGYRFGPPLKVTRAHSSDLVWRMGVCIAIAMNTMLFGVAVYAGLQSGPIARLFHALDFGLSALAVIIGGTVFFRSAWQSIRARVLHLDLPIALGILLAFASSTYTYAVRGGSSSYFDTLDVFIALMLVGRYLQERALAKNRAYLLASDGISGLLTRRLNTAGPTASASQEVALVRCTEIEEGDVLLIGHRDLVPVDAELTTTEPSLFSLDWINGESLPHSFEPLETIPAGAFSHGERAVTVRAKSNFDASVIHTLLASSNSRDNEIARATRTTPWWHKVTRIYVISVLAVAAVGAAAWAFATGDVARTLDVVAAVLIVTCPCAIGIATPLAYELAVAGLRRQGLFVRTPGFLDRAAHVERVVFDKTGTLTTGALTLATPDVLGSLASHEKAILADLALRSSHPKSRAIARALSHEGLSSVNPARVVREVAGKGLETSVVEDGREHFYRLGAPAWAMAHAKVSSAANAKADMLFSRDGVVLSTIALREELRDDAKGEVARLGAEGYETFVLSGDSPEATRTMAAACAIHESRAFGAQSPEGKRSLLRSLGAAKTLFVGDGINDSLVAEEASCAGTPAIDRPFMAARCDFYFVTPGLRPIRAALATARRTNRVVKTNLTIAVFYNLVAVGLALAGRMTPLACAVLMPISSLSTVFATVYRMRRQAWKY